MRALLAGFSLASNSYREAIATPLVSVRDFLLFFFVNLGAKLDLGALGDDLSSAAEEGVDQVLEPYADAADFAAHAIARRPRPEEGAANAALHVP